MFINKMRCVLNDLGESVQISRKSLINWILNCGWWVFKCFVAAAIGYSVLKNNFRIYTDITPDIVTDKVKSFFVHHQTGGMSSVCLQVWLSCSRSSYLKKFLKTSI